MKSATQIAAALLYVQTNLQAARCNRRDPQVAAAVAELEAVGRVCFARLAQFPAANEPHMTPAPEYA
ncbi:hypothetical protein WAE61_01945 [Comamonadaceae bacterium PP-2]